MKQHTKEFRLQAIKIADDLGSTTEAGKQLGVLHANISAWRKKHGAEPVTAAKKLENKPEKLVKENQRLLQENNQLKKVNHILKSAAAFF